MFFIRKYTLFPAAALLILASCKKEVNDETPEPVTAVADAIKDTSLSYSRDIYLWYNQIPSSFNARSHADPDEMMTAIRQYSIEPGFTDPVDRWSFAMKQKEWDDVSSGIAGDFGLGVFFRNSADLRVKLVEATSPAGLAGIRRGWRIIKINGNSDITTGNSDFVVKQVFNSSKTTFTFEKPDGATADVTLNAARYQENPVVLDSVYKIGGKNIGYFAFNSFLGDTTQIYNAFSRIFSRFVAQQVGDVIVDLRYNGGGYVSVQEKLANYLAPLNANGNLMMTQQFNDKNMQFNSTHYFKKQGTFLPKRLFFIVSKSTASASELLINNLTPWVNVQLVGPQKTYGKPVGFFPVPVADWYIFPVSFRTTNSSGDGSYFDGLALNKQVADGLDKDWGDVKESCLASVLNLIETGGLLGQPGPTLYTQKADVARGNDVLSRPGFKGMIDVRGMQ